MKKDKTYFQLVYGIVLVLVGIGVFFRIPQVMPKIKAIEYFASVIGFIYFSLYLLGALLVFGGARKIFEQARKLWGRGCSKAKDEN
jgi:hypothetical protein